VLPDIDTTETPAVDSTEVEPPEDHEAESPPPDDPADDSSSDETETDSFPRSYVEKLRRESAGYRERANSADRFAQRLHLELVRATGRLADPSDIPFDEAHLEGPEALAAAVDELLARKPHLASRRVSGEIGQGATPSAGGVDLAGMLRRRT
jgi:hypothetical protein